MVCHQHVGGQLAARGLLGTDEPRRHVGIAVDLVGVEDVVGGVFDVDEDGVVLGGPAAFGAAAVVVGPDDLVEEAGAPEDAVQQHLAVVRLAVVDVEVEGAVGGEDAVSLDEARGEEGEVVVEGVVEGARGDMRW